MIALFAGCSSKEVSTKPLKQTKSRPHKMMMFQSVPADKATLLQTGKEKAYCVNCGMTLPMFYKTNHASTVDDKQKQYCSIHCLAQDIMQGKDVKDIKVVDTNSFQFIDAKKAFYVLGSHKKGTMSPVSKYAFATKQEAEAFAKENGGDVSDFAGALALAEKDFSPEVKEKMMAKKAMMAKKGAMIYSQKCQKTTLPKFDSVASAKAFISEKNLCPDVKGKGLQALGIYLFTK
jgi:nitrous oxide reductase accessory protein NosL